MFNCNITSELKRPKILVGCLFAWTFIDVQKANKKKTTWTLQAVENGWKCCWDEVSAGCGTVDEQASIADVLSPIKRQHAVFYRFYLA